MKKHFSLVLLLFFSSCQEQAEMKNEELIVVQANPTWESNISEIFSDHCASCHSDGNVADYAKGNHVHIIAGSTINSALDGTTITNGIWNSTFGATANSLISGSFTALSSSLAGRITDEESDFTAAGISGSFQSLTLTAGETRSLSEGRYVYNVLVSSGATIYNIANGNVLVYAGISSVP